MALATQCPHCHTTFKVAYDQLKLRSGLVRCGACKQIFNGIENLVAPDQMNAGAQASVQERQKLVPAASLPAVSAPTAATIPAAAPDAAPPATPMVPEQAEPPLPSPAEPSTVNTLEFVSVDDPETQTRILAPEVAPPQSPPSNPAPVSDSTQDDEDPLTRMTLVDFSIFDNDIGQEPITQAADDSPGSAQQSEEIWPNTQEVIEPGEPLAAAEPEETTSAPQPEAPAPQPTQHPHVASDSSFTLDDTVTEVQPHDWQVDAASTVHSTHLASPDTEPAITEEPEIQPVPFKDTSAESVDELELDEEVALPLAAAVEADTEEPGFVVSERRRQRRRRILRIIMAIGSVVLLAALLAQSAHVFRNQLAARFPQTKPLLAQLCSLTECQVLLPAQIDQVSIESNELQMQAANKDVFTLSLLLHNRSTVTQAWPNIELTLNDKDGKALVRRVLSPREYLPKDRNPAEGIAARSEQPVNVSFELKQLQASDYRVYLFYP